MIKELVRQIVSYGAVSNKIWSMHRLLSIVKQGNELWPISSLNDVYNYIWSHNDVTLNVGLTMALGEYAINTQDQEAVNILVKIKETTYQHDLVTTVELYLEKI